jgi:malate dehydrogenase (oxaloacetate-decarboxylating)(NADP+)
VPLSVLKAYNLESLSFGKNYIIPKPLDPRLISSVASAVAQAAMDSGVAKQPINDMNEYKKGLDRRLSEHINNISHCSDL